MTNIDKLSAHLSKKRFEIQTDFIKKSALFKFLGTICVAALIFYLLPRLPSLGRAMMTLADVDWFHLMSMVFFTGIKVLLVIVFGSLWTIPIGLWLGLNPKVEKFLQPIIQNLASFPAPVLFPLITLVLIRTPLPAFLDATILMMMGAQWYILFNVVSGASRMAKDLSLVAAVYRFSLWQKLKNLYFPSIFPSLVTGWITAAGGAWNASMVAEIVSYPNGTLRTQGIGAEMVLATTRGDYPKLIASIICVVIVLVVINRSVWYILYEYAEKLKE